MSALWQLQEAKNRLSELLNCAESDGPQTITRHGRPVAVVLSMKDYEKDRKHPKSLVDFFRDSPLVGEELDFERLPDMGRDISL